MQTSRLSYCVCQPIFGPPILMRFLAALFHDAVKCFWASFAVFTSYTGGQLLSIAVLLMEISSLRCRIVLSRLDGEMDTFETTLHMGRITSRCLCWSLLLHSARQDTRTSFPRHYEFRLLRHGLAPRGRYFKINAPALVDTIFGFHICFFMKLLKIRFDAATLRAFISFLWNISFRYFYFHLRGRCFYYAERNSDLSYFAVLAAFQEYTHFFGWLVFDNSDILIWYWTIAQGEFR